MAIEGFQIKDQMLGTGDTTVYPFNLYLLNASDLLIWIQDASGNIVETHTGDDTDFVAGLTFDTDGSGTLTLVNDLPDEYTMTLLMANDAPDQTSTFKNQFSFTLENIEAALDRLAALLQRVAYLAQRSVKMHDLDDIDNFDPTLPFNIAGSPGGIISVKEDGSGFEIVVTTGEIAAAEGFASTAQSAQSAANASAIASAASAAAAAASAAMAATGFYCVSNPLSPINVTTAGIINNNKYRECQFVQGTGGVVVTANPQINPGTIVAQELLIIGTSDVNTVQINNGTGTSQNGNCILGAGDAICYVWDGTVWSEIYRRQAA
jgi:hypothetical protein